MAEATNLPAPAGPPPDALGDDVLKRLAAREAEGRADDLESLAGALDTPRARLAAALAALAHGGWLRHSGAAPILTAAGRARGLHLVRSHRLLETQLAREGRLKPEHWHAAADRAEHRLTPEAANRLADELGNPRFDPHGDPIPDREGHFAPETAPTLQDWPDGQPALVVHIEDEPPALFARLHAAGLAPGALVVVRARSATQLDVEVEGRARTLTGSEAGMLHVTVPGAAPVVGRRRLGDLRPGEAGVVAALAPVIQGRARQRLLDLGLVPGTRIAREFAAALRSPIAFRVRGTLIALRADQADQIFLEPAPAAPAGPRP